MAFVQCYLPSLVTLAKHSNATKVRKIILRRKRKLVIGIFVKSVKYLLGSNLNFNLHEGLTILSPDILFPRHFRIIIWDVRVGFTTPR